MFIVGIYDRFNILRTTIANFHNIIVQYFVEFVMWWKVLVLKFKNIISMLVLTFFCCMVGCIK